MNCEKGDLAIVVGKAPSASGRNLGKVYRCLRLSPRVRGLVARDGTINYGPVWEVDGEFHTFDGTSHNFVLDAYLRPIRDPGDDARDETLEWLPVPSRSMEPA